MSEGERLVLENGETYSGEVRNGKPNGFGTLTSKSGSNFTGTFVNGIQNGFFTVNYQNGNTYVGEFKNNKLEGKGVYTWSKGLYGGIDTYEGEFRNGLKNGKGVETYGNGDIYEGEFRNNKRYGYGKGILTQSNGDRYVGEFMNGNKEGNGTYTFTSGSVFTGLFKDDNRHGSGVLTWLDGRKYIGGYKNGLKHGKGVFIYPDGERFEVEWENGNRIGVGTYVYSSGNVYKGEFSNFKVWTGWGNFTYANDSQWKNYDGEWKSTIKLGYGKMTYLDGSVYNGFWNDKVREKDGLFYWMTNDTTFHGRMKDDQLFQGMLVTPAREVIFAPFKDGKPFGKGYKASVTNRKGILKCIRFDNGKEIERSCHKNPVSRIYHDNFDFYEGEVIEERGEELRHGFGEFTGDEGNYMIGKWKEDVQNGFGLQCIPWQPILIGNFNLFP